MLAAFVGSACPLGELLFVSVYRKESSPANRQRSSSTCPRAWQWTLCCPLANFGGAYMRLQRRILLIVLSMGSLLGAAATQPAKLGDAERAPGEATAAAAVSLGDRTPSTDDLLVAVANQVPGFGGMFIGADGLLRIYLLDPRQSAAAQAAIAAVFGRDRVSLARA